LLIYCPLLWKLPDKIVFSGVENIKDYRNMKITRDDLLIAAFKLFMSVNYEKASFAELGKMLGMSKAGIFKYYKNKQELFIAVVDRFWFSTQNPRNKFTETNGTFAEFIDEYVRGVQRTMDMLGKLIGADKVAPEKFSYHAQYFHFLFQVIQYDPDAKEKLHNLVASDYAYWRAAIQRAIQTGELKKDVDVEEAVVMFRQVYMGLSFEMAFLGGLDTQLLFKHLHAIYSLLKS
jgi:transcriptional regulator, TetR family